jgi:glycosyltransferase involved in cell wall biosynthesis
MSLKAGMQVVHVFPNSARVACGPCDAIKAFMACQGESGLDVRAISPVDDHIPIDQVRSIEQLRIREFHADREDFQTMPELRPDGSRKVFHFHGLSPWSDEIAKNLKTMAIPYVFTSHGHLHYRGLVHGLKKLVYLNLVNAFMRNAAGLHFLTQRERDRSRFILPFWHKKILVQPNLTQLPDRDGIKAVARELLGIPAKAFVFAYLGRLDVKHKGLDLLVEAFAGLAGADQVHLLLIGPDFNSGRAQLEQLARKLNCEKQVHFTGSKVGVAKWEFLKAADAFISPSRWEAFSIAMAEAIGFGLPTIVSDGINCASEMAAGRAAIVSRLSQTALAAAMSRLMTDPALCRSLSESGRRWVRETCSFSSAGPRFAAFYESLF